METCFQCGHRLREEFRCQVEEHDEYVDRIGRHYGMCWGGRFPKSTDIPPITDEELAEARERGAARFEAYAEQLQLDVSEAA